MSIMLRDTLYDWIWYGYGTNCYQTLPYATSMLTPIHAFGTNCYQILRFATSMLTPIHAYAEHTNYRSITEVKQHLARLAPDMCQDPKKIRDSGSRGSRIRDLAGSWNLHFHFLMGSYRSWILMVFYIEILGILDPRFVFHLGIP